MVTAGAAKSKGEARRLIESGGVYLNNQRVAASDRQVTIDESIEGQYLVLRKGKKDYFLVQVI
jgi:tyrosyl-tRNA synthetase